MRVEDDGVNVKIVLEHTGEIAQIVMAITAYNLQQPYTGGSKISYKILESLEEMLAQ